MHKIYPDKLQRGDTIRVVAPSSSFGIISKENREIALQRFKELGLTVTFGKHVEEIDEFCSSSIESRVSDLHEAFADSSVQAVFTVIGGFSCNELLSYLDWELIRKNPKIFIGYSDTTALQNAMFAKTGLVTYSGPAYSTFAQLKHFDYTMESFKNVLFEDKPYEVTISKEWLDDPWYRDQENRVLYKNEGWLSINPGEAKGTLLGANLCTLNLLQGTEYMPQLKDSILFIEDDEESRDVLFDRDLQSLLHQPGVSGVKGVVIGRFQKVSDMTVEKITKILRTKKELKHVPIIANVDFGHTSPMITFPIGGEVEIESSDEGSLISVVKH